jgi:hypothetical protein
MKTLIVETKVGNERKIKVMEASEINLTRKGWYFLYVQNKNGQHLDLLIRLGRVMPTFKACALKVAKLGAMPNILNIDDVLDYIEPMMNKHGFKGEYHYTKSKDNIRLVNFGDWHSALKMEYK